MGTFEAFEQALQDKLTNLYSPAYQPPEFLWEVLSNSSSQGKSLNSTIIAAIEAFAPPSHVPPGARSKRLYDILFYRYIEGLTQKETAQRLGITSRHVRREQQRAVSALAQKLWEERDADHASLSPRNQSVEPVTDRGSGETGKSMAWRSQIKRELDALQQSSPGTFADVGAVIHTALKSVETLVTKHQVVLRSPSVAPGLTTTLHPAILREVVITAVEKLLPHMMSGEISIEAVRRQSQILLSITGYPTTAGHPPHSDFVKEALAMQGGSLSVTLEDECAVFSVVLPLADKVKILVIEDNEDLVHFYRHYTARTRYEIIHASEGSDIFNTIVETEPNIIMLDILLPDIDGWELLNQLHEHPATRKIPVIVCSVVRREELSLALGAIRYLQKPVRRQEFIQALDQVLAQMAAESKKI